MRIGIGYDVHRLVEGRPLILGGVAIPYPKGLLGHSDADVVIHAVCDALLGALALGNIGTFFPDTDASYRGISSLVLLGHVMTMVRQEGYAISNIDATIMAQEPKLNPFIPAMRAEMAEVMALSTSRISLKATTGEGVGFVGRSEAIAVHAVALLHVVG